MFPRPPPRCICRFGYRPAGCPCSYVLPNSGRGSPERERVSRRVVGDNLNRGATPEFAAAPVSRLAHRGLPRGGCLVGDREIFAAAARPKKWCPAARGIRETPEGQDVLRAATPQPVTVAAFAGLT
jgi:hypothetical protein